MTHRELTIKLVDWLLTRPGIDLAINEIAFGRGIADAIGISTRPKYRPFKVLAIEAKISRADLLQDLQKRKYLKYEKAASHCYIACQKDILRGSSDEELVKDLSTKGLPNYWGILLVGKDIRVLRRSQRIKPISIATIRKLAIQIAKSYMWKTIKSN
jgi:hypothetical protein